MKKLIILLIAILLLCGCASTPQVQGVDGTPLMGRTEVRVGRTSVVIVPQRQVSNGVVFVMEDGKVYWSKRFIENEEMLRLMQNEMDVQKWVHLSPVSEGQIQKGDVILVCKNHQLYCLYY
jgi:uncharacterized lipoprotein YajG